jgi:ribose transport system permease protein
MGPALGLFTVVLVFIVLLRYRGDEDSLGNFLSTDNLKLLVYSNTPLAVLSLGMLLVMISGGIDLSVGSVVALVTVVTMTVYSKRIHAGDSMAAASWWAVAAGAGTGGLCGLVNGIIITQLRVAPFVTTLGMLSIARGLAYWISGRTSLSFPEGKRPDWVNTLSDAFPDSVLFFNPGFWSLALLAILVAVFLKMTVLGRYCYAIGSNEATARLCGVAIERNKMIIWTLAGLIFGWGGILMFATLGSGEPGGATGLELNVIAAVVIGGASLTGGVGTVSGTLLGVLVLGVLDNGVNRCRVPVEIKFILVGAIIIANTSLSRWRNREVA